MSNTDNAIDNIFSKYTKKDEKVNLSPNATQKDIKPISQILPQDQTSYAKLDARDFYRLKFSEVGVIGQPTQGSDLFPYKTNLLDGSYSVALNFNKLSILISMNGGKTSEVGMNQLYQKLFSGAKPEKDLLDYNNQQDALYSSYVDSANKYEPEDNDVDFEGLLKDTSNSDNSSVDNEFLEKTTDENIENLFSKETKTRGRKPGSKNTPKIEKQIENVEPPTVTVLDTEQQLDNKSQDISTSNPIINESSTENQFERDLTGFLNIIEHIIRDLVSR